MKLLKILISNTFLLATVCTHAAAPLHLSEAQARYFLVRTGFAPQQAEVQRLTGQSARLAVSDLIKRAQVSRPKYPGPGFTVEPIAYGQLKTPGEQQSYRQQRQRELMAVKTWWMQEMVQSSTPLQERMTLFWHNHFATSHQKVRTPQTMWRQHLLLRGQALGNFRRLLHGIAKDPAMLLYLDGANSRKEAPNENFAREVMELFTLGEATQGGHYTEQDIKEAARAFTGWTVNRKDDSFRLRPAIHDAGNKTLLGHTGSFDGDAVLDILLEQPVAAHFIVVKLWKEFVSPTPDNAEVERIARHFRASGYDIGTVLNDLLLTDAFWADSNRGSLIKSPVELIVGTLRQFDFRYSDITPFVIKAAQLGQNLLAPPNVKGWPGQNDWINATTLLERKRFTEQLFRAVELKGESRMVPIATGADGQRVDEDSAFSQMRQLPSRNGRLRVGQNMATISFAPDQWLAQYGGALDREPSDELKIRLAQTVLAVPATQTIAKGTVGVAYLRTLTLDPAYQLK